MTDKQATKPTFAVSLAEDPDDTLAVIAETPQDAAVRFARECDALQPMGFKDPNPDEREPMELLVDGERYNVFTHSETQHAKAVLTPEAFATYDGDGWLTVWRFWAVKPRMWDDEPDVVDRLTGGIANAVDSADGQIARAEKAEARVAELTEALSIAQMQVGTCCVMIADLTYGLGQTVVAGKGLRGLSLASRLVFDAAVDVLRGFARAAGLPGDHNKPVTLAWLKKVCDAMRDEVEAQHQDGPEAPEVSS